MLRSTWRISSSVTLRPNWFQEFQPATHADGSSIDAGISQAGARSRRRLVPVAAAVARGRQAALACVHPQAASPAPKPSPWAHLRLTHGWSKAYSVVQGRRRAEGRRQQHQPEAQHAGASGRGPRAGGLQGEQRWKCVTEISARPNVAGAVLLPRSRCHLDKRCHLSIGQIASHLAPLSALRQLHNTISKHAHYLQAVPSSSTFKHYLELDTAAHRAAAKKGLL